VSKIDKIVINRYFISLISAIFISTVILLISDKYTASLISKEYNAGNLARFYHDLDHDKKSEKIELHHYREGKASILVYQNERIIMQQDFNGNFKTHFEPVIDDFDNDGIDEIFLFTQFKDSLFLSCIDAISNKNEFSKIPLCKLYTLNETYAYTISPAGMHDVNGDGVKEFFFSIRTGYITRPRNMFAYYPAEDRLYISPESCAHIIDPFIFDLDEDGIPEFFGRNQATGNCGYEREYTDMYSWLMVFTPEMEFKFPPVIVGKYPSNTEFIPYNHNDKNCILAFHWYEGTEDIIDYIALFDSNGDKITSREIPSDKNCKRGLLFAPDNSYNSIFLFTPAGVIYSIRENLEFEIKAKISEVTRCGTFRIDVDGDLEKEYIFTSKSRQELIIYRSNFSNPVYLDFSELFGTIIISMIEDESASLRISISTDMYNYIYSYSKTIVYKYWYLLSIFIYLFAMLAIFLFHKIREFRNIKILHTRKQLVELQLKSIQNQIDPHFTFNLLQSFGSLITENDTERANYLFNKYAGMLKTTVLNSDKTFVPLHEELDFLISYLDLEKFRQRDRFSYNINISDEIDTKLQIPKMLLHTFVENAIKHGLRHLESNGKLEIDAIRQNGTIILNITDNGVGRQKASEYGTFSTGKGLGIVDQILELYYVLFKIRIQYKIIDIINKGKPGGTRINITIPV